MIWVAFDATDSYASYDTLGTRFRMGEWEDGRHVVYEGVTYKGGFGYNLWVASKYVEL